MAEAAGGDLHSQNHKSHNWFQHLYCVNSRECLKSGVFVAKQNHGSEKTVEKIGRKKSIYKWHRKLFIPKFHWEKESNKNKNKGFAVAWKRDLF